MRLLLLFVLTSAQLFAGAEFSSQFKNPPGEARTTMYWIWFGPAVTRQGIDRDLRNMKAAHIGGTVLLPIYPLSADDPASGIRNLPYLSPGFLEMLRYAATRSHELGMTFDVTLGTGWPFGGPWITPETAARKLRMRPDGEASAPGEVLISRAAGKSIVSVPTGMKVKRPALGDEGLVLDHYSRQALDRHLAVAGSKLYEALRGTGFRSFWCDSLEVFGANWTPRFLDNFQRARGYDLKPLLPQLFESGSGDGAHIRRDFWLTLAEEANRNFLAPFQAWCRAHGVAAHVEAYGQPPVSLNGHRYVDLPVGEELSWRMLTACRWASSGGHLYGKNVIGAEAWTWIGMPNRFADSLETLKVGADMHFVSGVNALMGCAWAYTPESAGKPGWVQYWGPIFNHNQTWWPYLPLFNRYLERVSWALRQGRAVADVALYLPIDDARARSTAGKELNLFFAARDLLAGSPGTEFGISKAYEEQAPVITGLLRSGYSFDLIDSSTLPETRIERQRLKMGLADFRVVVVPNIQGMPLEDAEKLLAFVRAGGRVIFTRRMPDVAWGWLDREDRTRRLRKVMKEILAAGRAWLVVNEGIEFTSALGRACPPDLRFDPADDDLAFVHRQAGSDDLYFIANLKPEAKRVRVRLRAKGAMEQWDPMTGEPRGRFVGSLNLNPFESVILRTATSPRKAQVAATSRAIELSPVWKVTIGDAQRNWQRLISWTDDAELRNFSGTAEYEATVEFPAAARLELDLGDVREIAEVSVNGQPAGVAWMRPYRVDISRVAKAGQNRLTIKVTNLWINAMLGRPEPDYSALRKQFGPRFYDPSEWKKATVLPSGLLGPIRLLVTDGH